MAFSSDAMAFGNISSSGSLVSQDILSPSGYKNLVHCISIMNQVNIQAIVGILRYDGSNYYQLMEVPLYGKQGFDIPIMNEGWVIESGHKLAISLIYYNSGTGNIHYSVDGIVES